MADHYFIMLKIMGEDPTIKTNKQVHKQVLDNSTIDDKVKRFNCNSLLHLDHITLYETVVEKFNDIYENSKRTIKLTLRKPSNNWIDKEILELSSEKK